MNIQIDRQNDIPRITENGKLVYSEKSDTLYIRTLKEGTKAIGGNASIVETDPVFQAWLATPPNVSIFTNDAGYLTSFTETDPIFSLWQSNYDNHTDWDTAYGWGNHASVGYLTSYTETDPVFTTWLGTNPFSSYLTSATAASTYYPIPVGTTAQYIRGDGSLATFPTNVSSFTNDSGFITSSALTGYIQNNVGISGGTTLIGDTASGGNLTLSSTSHATKGKILFGTSAYNEVNNRLGIGTTTPAYLLSIGSISKGFAEYNSGGGLDGIKVVANNAGAGFGVQNLAINGFSGVEYIGSDGALKVFTGYQNSTGEFRFNNIATNGYITFKIAGSDKLTIANTGNVGIGTTSPTAYLHLKAGTATAGTAPVKFTTGTNTTVAVAGQIEYNNTFHLTNSDATRRHIVTAPNTTKVTASAPYTNDGYIVVNIAGTDFKILTTA